MGWVKSVTSTCVMLIEATCGHCQASNWIAGDYGADDAVDLEGMDCWRCKEESCFVTDGMVCMSLECDPEGSINLEDGKETPEEAIARFTKE